MKSKVTRRSILRWALMAFFLLVFFAPSTFDLLKEKWVISRAVANAKSIRLEHYRNRIDGFDSEQIIASKELSSEDFHKVAATFPVCLDAGLPGSELACIFNPHHRIIITDFSGNVTVIRVCFECDHFDVTHGNQEYGEITRTPFVWMATLRRFFADEGMPNSPELYRPNWAAQPVIPAPATNAAPTGAPR